jgi:hypothetical protein
MDQSSCTFFVAFSLFSGFGHSRLLWPYSSQLRHFIRFGLWTLREGTPAESPDPAAFTSPAFNANSAARDDPAAPAPDASRQLLTHDHAAQADSATFAAFADPITSASSADPAASATSAEPANPAYLATSSRPAESVDPI